MPETIAGRLDRGDELLCDEVEATIEVRRIVFDFTDGEAWLGERHMLVAADGRVIEFTIDRRHDYNPGDDLETVEGEITWIDWPTTGEDHRSAAPPSSSGPSA